MSNYFLSFLLLLHLLFILPFCLVVDRFINFYGNFPTNYEFFRITNSSRYLVIKIYLVLVFLVFGFLSSFGASFTFSIFTTSATPSTFGCGKNFLYNSDIISSCFLTSKNRPRIRAFSRRINFLSYFPLFSTYFHASTNQNKNSAFQSFVYPSTFATFSF